MSSIITGRPDCFDCKHLDEFSFDPLKCQAFPEGIPEEILTGEHDHSKPFEGDNGIQFEPIEKEE